MHDLLRCAALVCATTCLLPLVPAHAQKVDKNLTYITGPEGPERADLYEPAGNGPFPAIVYIHGGSWRSGNKRVYQRFATDLANSGYAGFAINYDLHPHSFPTSLQEAQAAVRFLREHAIEYRIDPNKILVAGDSAGGEIAALVALAPEDPATPKEPAKKSFFAPDDTSAAVSGAVIFNGVYRLSSKEFLYVYVITRYLGVRCLAEPIICKGASPLQQIRAGDPPFFIGHGTKDHTVPYGEAELFIHALQAQHVPVSAYVATGGPHSYWKKSTFYSSNLAAVKTFLGETLHPATIR